MTTNEKIKNAASMLQAMGLADTDMEKQRTLGALAQELGVDFTQKSADELTGSKADKIKVIRELAEKSGLTAADIFPQEKSVVKPPEGFEVKEFSSSSLRYARYNGDIIGVIFQVDGKHFIFSHKDKFTNVSHNDIAKRLDELDRINGQQWRIPSVREFREVQKLHPLYNELSDEIGGSRVDEGEYMDTNTPDSKRVRHVRLSIWAPWLD